MVPEEHGERAAALVVYLWAAGQRAAGLVIPETHGTAVRPSSKAQGAPTAKSTSGVS